MPKNQASGRKNRPDAYVLRRFKGFYRLTSTLDLRLMATIAVVSSITLAIVTKNCVDAMLRREKLR